MSEITKFHFLSSPEFLQLMEDFRNHSVFVDSGAVVTEAIQRLEALKTFEDLQDLRLSAETVAISELKALAFEDKESRHKAAADTISEFLEALGFEEMVEAWDSALLNNV